MIVLGQKKVEGGSIKRPLACLGLRFQEFRCKSDISIFPCRVAYNYTYSPFYIKLCFMVYKGYNLGSLGLNSPRSRLDDLDDLEDDEEMLELNRSLDADCLLSLDHDESDIIRADVEANELVNIGILRI